MGVQKCAKVVRGKRWDLFTERGEKGNGFEEKIRRIRRRKGNN